jgi:hypothetical protein
MLDTIKNYIHNLVPQSIGMLGSRLEPMTIIIKSELSQRFPYRF